MLQALSSWHHSVLFLFITSSLADWTLDSPSGGLGGLDDPALQLRFDANPIVPSTVTVTDDFISTSGADGVLNLAQVSRDGNIGEVANVEIDPPPPTFEIASSRCSPPSSGKKRRRVRRGNDSTACSAGDMFKNSPSQFKQPAAEPGKEQTPTADPGSKKAPPSANASPRRFIPKLSPEAEYLSRIFLPEENRPREDDYTCRKQGYYIPVCALDDSEKLGQMNGGFVNFLDPCLPAPRSAACPVFLSKWCCRRVEIALTSLTEDLFAPFRQSLLTRPQIYQTLQRNANPFKLIGISCIQIPDGQEYLPAY